MKKRKKLIITGISILIILLIVILNFKAITYKIDYKKTINNLLNNNFKEVILYGEVAYYEKGDCNESCTKIDLNNMTITSILDGDISLVKSEDTYDMLLNYGYGHYSYQNSDLKYTSRLTHIYDFNTGTYEASEINLENLTHKTIYSKDTYIKHFFSLKKEAYSLCGNLLKYY